MPFPGTGGVSSGDLVNRKFLLFGADYTQQSPTATDTALRVSFGSSQSATQFDLDADGLITCKVAGTYDYRFTGQAARAAVSGTAWLYLRVVVNGSQVFQTALVKMPTSNTDRPIQFSFTLTNAANDEVEIQMARGSEGANDGYLEANSTAEGNAPVIGWSDVASASIAITTSEIA